MILSMWKQQQITLFLQSEGKGPMTGFRFIPAGMAFQ